jgi:hypothetical protein
MSANTWAKLIAKYCITDSTLIFNGTNLDKYLSLQQNEHLHADGHEKRHHRRPYWRLPRGFKKIWHAMNLLLLCY